ncbi:hypothetical protein DFAR_3690018 [Desulfarculales bacterium]
MEGAQFYVAQALSKIDLGEVTAVALDKTASKRDHNYATVLIDLDRKQKPVIFVAPGKNKGYLILLRRCLREHGGDHNNIAEVICDISPASLAAIGESSPDANVTVNWFHVVQFFTTAVDDVRKAEAKERKLLQTTRWTVLKAADGGRLTEKQQQALTELESGGFATTTAWRLQEMLRWIRKAISVRAAQWRVTLFTRHALKRIAPDTKILAPDPQGVHDSGRACPPDPKLLGLQPFQRPPGGLNGIFQADRASARKYRNVFTFMTTIYFIAAPLK